MGHKFAEIAFTEAVRLEQEERGSRAAYARFDEGEDSHHELSEQEAEFIANPQARPSACVRSRGTAQCILAEASTLEMVAPRSSHARSSVTRPGVLGAARSRAGTAAL